jgi:hypothetical protein
MSARLTHRKSPLVALLLIGFSPTLLIWGDTLRAYGLGVFWIVLSFACFWRLLDRPKTREAIFAAIVATLSVQSLFTNAFLILALGLSVCVVSIYRRTWMSGALALVAGSVAALSLLPYLPTISSTRSWAWVNQVWSGPRSHLRILSEAVGGGSKALIFLWVATLLVAAIFALLGSRESVAEGKERSPKGELACYSLLTLVIGGGATFAFFCWVGWGTNVWYFLPALALVAVAIDAMASTSELRLIVVVRLVGTALVIILLLPALLRTTEIRASNLDLVATVITQHARKGDSVVIYPFVDGVTFNRYFHRDLNWVTLPPVDDHSLHNWSEVVRQLETPEAIQPVLAGIGNTLDSHGRVWLIVSLPLPQPGRTPPPVPPHARTGDLRPLGTFLVGWSNLLVDYLNKHARSIRAVLITSSQPISIYEKADVFLIEGTQSVSINP